MASLQISWRHAALLAAAVLGALPAAALQLKAGDLLVTDAANARVLHVDPATGSVHAFSPRIGSGDNLLFAPAGIAIEPGGLVFVADSFADRIVQIDPTTGAQSVLQDWSAQFGDFGPADVGTAPQGVDLEDEAVGLDRRDLFVASADGVYQVTRVSDGSSSARLSNAADLLLGNDVAVQQDGGVAYSLWVVGNGVLVRYFFADGSTQARTTSAARNVAGVEYAFGTLLFTRSDCYEASPLNGLFLDDGTFDGLQLEDLGYASCLGRPLAAASPTSVFGTYGDAQIVELVPTINGYASAVVATLPAGSVAAVAADLAVSPTTFPAPEPAREPLAFAAALALLAIAQPLRRAATR